MVFGENMFWCFGIGFFISVSGLLIIVVYVFMDLVEWNYGGVKEIDDCNWDIGFFNLGVLIMMNLIF